MGSRIWYASYGSNLSYEKRFLCYIAGGRPDGSQKVNPGCRDKTPPTDKRPITIPFELYFAEHSEWWGGGVAFVKHSKRNVKTLGRMYLIKEDQFNDVVLQENSKPVNGQRLVPEIEFLVRQRELLLPDIRMYGRLLNIGNADDYPIFTFTNASDDLRPQAPSKAYIKIIVAGMKDTYPAMTNAEIVEYMTATDGVRNNISPQEITNWIAEAR